MLKNNDELNVMRMWITGAERTKALLEVKSLYATKQEIAKLNVSFFQASCEAALTGKHAFNDLAKYVAEWEPMREDAGNLNGSDLERAALVDMLLVGTAEKIEKHSEGDTVIFHVFTEDVSSENWKKYTEICFKYEDMDSTLDLEVILFNTDDYEKVEC